MFDSFPPLTPPTPERRLSFLMERLRELSLDQDPVRSVNRYAAGMRLLYGNEAMISVSLRDTPPGHYRVMRFLHQQGLNVEGLSDLLYAGANAPAVRGGILGGIIEAGEPVVLRDLAVVEDPVLGPQLAPYRFLLGFPVFNEGLALNWMFFLQSEGEGFSDYEVETSILHANLMGGISNSKRMTQDLRQATAWIHREVDEIAGLQRGLLPETLPSSPQFGLGASYATYERAGGDFYTAFEISCGEEPPALGIFIADASGHGPSAAVVIAMVSTLLRACPQPLLEPARVMDHINEVLSGTRINHSFVTALYAVLHPASLRLDYTCSGHPMPVSVSGAGALEELPRAQDIPLGIRGETQHQQFSLVLTPGHRLLFYTDGVTEARNPAHQFWGEAGLSRAFQGAAGSPDQQIAQVNGALRDFTQGMPPLDDQTLLLVDLR